MNRINKLTILLLSITGSIMLTGCSSTDKKLVQQHTASTFEYGRNSGSYGAFYPYSPRFAFGQSCEQRIHGMGTSILELAKNKTTKLSVRVVDLTSKLRSQFRNLKIVSVACDPEKSAKLTIDKDGCVHILPKNGHLKTKLYIICDNGLKQNFLAYFINKKLQDIECIYNTEDSFQEHLRWLSAVNKRIEYDELSIDEALRNNREIIAFLKDRKREQELYMDDDNADLKKVSQLLINSVTKQVNYLEKAKSKLLLDKTKSTKALDNQQVKNRTQDIKAEQIAKS